MDDKLLFENLSKLLKRVEIKLQGEEILAFARTYDEVLRRHQELSKPKIVEEVIPSKKAKKDGDKSL